MAKYSPIAPLPLLLELQANKALGSYLLLLAHDVLANPSGYIELVDNMHREVIVPHIIMDNGVVELGEALNLVEVIEAANLVEATSVVMPDVLGDFVATQKRVMEQIQVMRNSEIPVMKVPQGSNNTELVQCVDWLTEYFPVSEGIPDYWGIPRWIANDMGSRIPLIQYINAKCTDPKIHLLGMSKWPFDDMRCTKLPGVMGIDSANPIVLGLAGVSMSKGPITHMERGNYWECTELHSEAQANVEWMHAYLR